jgi:hypothetical protein
MRSRLGCRFVVLAVLMVVPLPAFAEPSDKGGAEALFDQARKLMDAKRYAEACEKFAASHRLDPAVGTLLNLGECNERQDHLASAWVYYREAQALAQSRADGEREKYARDHAAGLEPKLAKLTIVAKNAPAGLEVKRDGGIVRLAALGTAMPIDVGRHTIEALAPGRKRWRTRVEVPRDGASVSVEVPALEAEDSPLPESAAAVPPPADEPAPTGEKPLKPSARENGLGFQRTAALIAGGVGVVSLAFGGFFVARAWSNWQDARPHCTRENVCDDRGFDLGQTARSQGDVATAAFAVGGLAVAIGAVLWLTAPSAPAGRVAFGVATMGTRAGLVGNF